MLYLCSDVEPSTSEHREDVEDMDVDAVELTTEWLPDGSDNEEFERSQEENIRQYRTE